MPISPKKRHYNRQSGNLIFKNEILQSFSSFDTSTMSFIAILDLREKFVILRTNFCSEEKKKKCSKLHECLTLREDESKRVNPPYRPFPHRNPLKLFLESSALSGIPKRAK